MCHLSGRLLPIFQKIGKKNEKTLKPKIRPAIAAHVRLRVPSEAFSGLAGGGDEDQKTAKASDTHTHAHAHKHTHIYTHTPMHTA